MKKLAVILSAVLTLSVLLGGCAGTKGPKATPNPNLSSTEGGVLSGDELGVEGTITSLTEEEMKVKVGKEKYKFTLGESGKNEISLFNKDPENPRIMVGTYVYVYYEEAEGEKLVKTIEIVESN